MAGGDDDYGDAFKTAKLEHDQQLEAPTEAKRLQAEADADIAVLSMSCCLNCRLPLRNCIRSAAMWIFGSTAAPEKRCGPRRLLSG